MYHGPGKRVWKHVPDATLHEPGDAVVRVEAVTICGTDLHILGGDVPEVTPGRILGHEAVGTVTAVGAEAGRRRSGPGVVCLLVRQLPILPRRQLRAVPGRRRLDLGHLIDGTQAEYVRVPFADNSTYKAPNGVTDEQMIVLADILPTAYEVAFSMVRYGPPMSLPSSVQDRSGWPR